MTRAIVIMFLLAGCYFTAFGAVSGYKADTAPVFQVASNNNIASNNSVDIDPTGFVAIVCIGGVVLIACTNRRKGND